MQTLRWIRFALLAAATGLLLATAWYGQAHWSAWRQAQMQALQARQSWQAAQGLLPELQRREAMASQVQALTSALAQNHFDRSQWGERRIRRPLSEATRVDAAAFLQALQPPGVPSILVAEQFDLGVRSKDAGLFNPPQPGDEGVQLALTATQYFQRETRP
jgi:homoserine acetyltransferase